MKQSLRPVMIGAVVGLALSALVSNLIRVLLWGISPLDALSFGAVTMFLLGSAALASYVPARRALRVDPMAALRDE